MDKKINKVYDDVNNYIENEDDISKTLGILNKVLIELTERIEKLESRAFRILTKHNKNF